MSFIGEHEQRQLQGHSSITEPEASSSLASFENMAGQTDDDTDSLRSSSLASSDSAAFSLVDEQHFQDLSVGSAGSKGEADASLFIKGGLKQSHIDRITSRNWKSVLSWIAFAPDEISNLLDREGQTVLHHACLFRAPSQVVEALLLCCPELASVKNDEGELALHWAVRLNLPMEILRLILNANPRAGFERDLNGVTALDLLWDRHSDTLISLFVKENSNEVVRTFHTWKRMLVVVNAYFTSKTGTCHCDHVPELHMISSCPCSEAFLRFSIRLYSNQISEVDDRGKLPLHCAAEATHGDNLGIILCHSPSDAVRRLDKSGRLPLHYAVQAGKKWKGGLELLVVKEPRSLGIMEPSTRLYPAMMAAHAESCDLGTLYQLFRLSPELARCQ